MQFSLHVCDIWFVNKAEKIKFCMLWLTLTIPYTWVRAIERKSKANLKWKSEKKTVVFLRVKGIYHFFNFERK